MTHSLTDKTFEQFFELMTREGFQVSLERRFQIVEALNQWNGGFSPERLRTLLCPLIATNADEQARFYTAFDRYFPNFAGLRPEERDKGSTGKVPGAHSVNRKQGRWKSWLIWASAALVVLALVAWVWIRSSHTLIQTQNKSTTGQVAGTANAAALKPNLLASRLREWALGIASVCLLWAVFEVWAFRTRRVILERAPRELRGDAKRVISFAVDAHARARFAAVTRRLRQPLKDRQVLNLKCSVEATIRTVGFPVLRFLPSHRRPGYIVLIDRASIRDQQARLYEEYALVLDRSGLRVRTLSFRGDPRVCRDLKTGKNIYLDDLYNRTSDQNLLLFTTSSTLLSPEADLTSAGKAMRWERCTVLTPLPPDEWGPSEFQVARYFLLLPATAESLIASAEYFGSEREIDRHVSPSRFINRSRNLDRASVGEIKAALGNDGLYQWLCACAIYPQLHWEITLRLGQKLDPRFLQISNIEKLVRLPFFRRGSIPLDIREQLVKSLSRKERLQLRQAVIDLLREADSNTALSSRETDDLEVAIQQLDLSPGQRSKILDDEVVAKVISTYGGHRQSFLLPSSLRDVLFPYGVPALGLRGILRRALFLSCLLACFGLALLYTQKFVTNPVAQAGHETAKRIASVDYSADASPYGYTISLLIFIVPSLAIALWFLSSEGLTISKQSFLWTVGLLFPLGGVLDFFLVRYFFVFPNPAATIGIKAPALGGGVPIEEYVFYLTGFVAALLLYIWLDEYWLAAYSVDAKKRITFDRLLRFHPYSFGLACVLISAAFLYQRYVLRIPGRFPGYFICLVLFALLPSTALLPAARPVINWRALTFTMFMLLGMSLLWEVTLALPYGWWNFREEQMLGIRITAWSSLPMEEIYVWAGVTYSAVIVYETVKRWKSSGRSMGNAFLGASEK